MSHAFKVEALMATRGVAPSTAAPPLWNLCWSLGLEIPPPLFMSPPLLWMFSGASFGILFGFAAWALGHHVLLPLVGP